MFTSGGPLLETDSLVEYFLVFMNLLFVLMMMMMNLINTVDAETDSEIQDEPIVNNNYCKYYYIFL